MSALDWSNVLAAAAAHHAVTERGYRQACYDGDCEHGEDECPEHDFIVCDACMELAREVNDEVIPNGALADKCAVCVAVEAAKAASLGLHQRPSDEAAALAAEEHRHSVTSGDYYDSEDGA